MLPSAYRDVFSSAPIRNVILLGVLSKVPLTGVGVILTLHVVKGLGYDYGRAGIVGGATTMALALSAPWRGRLLDRVGLRRTIAPAIVVNGVGWSIAPWVGYAPLLVIAVATGLFVIPVWAIVRQALLAAAPAEQRKAALSLDTSLTEVAFMTGPALGAWLAVTWDTRYALLSFALAAVAGGLLIWWINPPLMSADLADRGPRDPAEPAAADGPADRHLLRHPSVLAVLVVTVAFAVLMVGTDLGLIAAMRAMDREPAIGLMMSLWALGSLVGGLVYGSLHRSFSSFWLLGVLAILTAPLALATSMPVFALLITATGLLCGPTLIATVDVIGRLVPEARRGEAIGWHASSLTLGQGVGAPAIGFVIDHLGWASAFVGIAALGVLVAAIGTLVGPQYRRRLAVRAM